MKRLTEKDDQGNWCLKGIRWEQLHEGQDITLICPVTDYMAVNGGAIAIYEMDGERREKEFLEEDVYACDETSRVIAVGKEYEDGSRTLRLYLYLSEEDYAQYTKDRFNLD